MKNGFLTFCFAFMPGAGQMYQGYMKRGLSLVSLFFGGCALVWLAEPLLLLLPIVWMYSFFDTFNLRAQRAAGTAPEDDYLIHLGRDVSLQRLLARRHKLFGWVLVALGGYVFYDEFILDTLRELIWGYEIQSRLVWVLFELLDELPQLAVCLALIALGLWLVRGPRIAPAAPQPPEADEEFCDYLAQEQEEQDAGTEN